MPYDPNNPPAKVGHLPDKEKRRWCHVWNSVYNRTGDETRAFKAAWGTVRKWDASLGFDIRDADIIAEIEADSIEKDQELISKVLGSEVFLKSSGRREGRDAGKEGDSAGSQAQ